MQTDEYLPHVSRYIHLNPVHAGLVKKHDYYLWSSYGALIGGVKAPHWLGSKWLLSKFDINRRKAIKGKILPSKQKDEDNEDQDQTLRHTLSPNIKKTTKRPSKKTGKPHPSYKSNYEEEIRGKTLIKKFSDDEADPDFSSPF